jgi:uncharacterized protein (DUF1499 family)
MSSAALYIGIAAVASVALSPALAHFGVLPPLRAFMLWLASVLPGIAAILTGLLALVLKRGTPATNGAAIVLGLVPVILLASVIKSGARQPRMNDVSTDLDDPPAFVQAKDIPANKGRSLEYPERFKPMARKAYADVVPVVRDGTPAQLLERAVAAAKDLGWTVTAVEADRFEAVVRSELWRFEDDVVVRAREASSGKARLDIRSKSRDGQGDFGANAARIRALSAKL